MTKTKVRAYTRRCREGLAGFNEALSRNDPDELLDWANEVSGAAAALYEYVEQLSPEP